MVTARTICPTLGRLLAATAVTTSRSIRIMKDPSKHLFGAPSAGLGYRLSAVPQSGRTSVTSTLFGKL